MAQRKNVGRRAAAPAERKIEPPVKAPARVTATGSQAAKGGASLLDPRAAGKGLKGRKPNAEARRQAILDAALTVFAERGYEAARLDDVAAKAGVAKGTLYLYFKDKQHLFEELVRSAVAPLFEQVGAAALGPGAKAMDIVEMFFALFQKEVLGTRRKLLLRLIISEGPRFPAVAEFYYREVVSRGLQLMRAVAAKAVEQGAFPTDAVARYPQLLVAPLLMAVIWDGLFARIDPLDVAGLMRAHRELLTAGGGKDTP